MILVFGFLFAVLLIVLSLVCQVLGIFFPVLCSVAQGILNACWVVLACTYAILFLGYMAGWEIL